MSKDNIISLDNPEWKAVRKVFSQTRSQRCWVHKTANILNKLPKHSQAKAKQYIHDIWMAETRENAEQAFDLFIKTYELKYPKATQCIEKDREELLAFYDFPADHWPHIRTTNPIESTFSTIRLRTKKTRACVSRTTILTMVYKLGLSAEKGWRKLRGFRRLARIFHEKEMANPFQAYKIRLNANSKKGIRRDRLYTHPTRFPRFQTS